MDKQWLPCHPFRVKFVCQRSSHASRMVHQIDWLRLDSGQHKHWDLIAWNVSKGKWNETAHQRTYPLCRMESLTRHHWLGDEVELSSQSLYKWQPENSRMTSSSFDNDLKAFFVIGSSRVSFWRWITADRLIVGWRCRRNTEIAQSSMWRCLVTSDMATS